MRNRAALHVEVPSQPRMRRIAAGSLLAWMVFDRIARCERAGLVEPATSGPIRNDVVAVLVGLVVYALFGRKLHDWLIEVPVLV